VNTRVPNLTEGTVANWLSGFESVGDITSEERYAKLFWKLNLKPKQFLN